MKVRIGHFADIQVKNREQNLYVSYHNHLKELVEIVEDESLDVVVLPGDLFEYPKPNESERKLISMLIVELAKIETLKEIVLISGNHDYVKPKKLQQKSDAFDGNIQMNIPVLNAFSDVIKSVNDELNDKIKYLEHSMIYDSVFDDINYVAYSLEDDGNPDLSELNPRKFNICVYHAMLKEYVDSSGLPLKKSDYEALDSIEMFPQNTLILAGDIHKKLKYEGLSGQEFYYPGSTQQRDHGEGDYITIVNDKVVYKPADEKIINIFEIDTETNKYELFHKSLTDYVKYYTIDINPSVDDIDIVINYLIEIFKDITFGNNQNYIKVKSLTKFVKNERQLFDTINGFNKNNNFNVFFDYEKLVVSSVVTNEVVKDVINEISKENEDGFELVLSKENIDNLILQNDDVVRLFESTLDSQLDKTNMEDIDRDTIKNDTMALFIKELEERNVGKRYNVVSKSISCNSFMLLGENNIDLDIPGIVRIIGTNKIGKTTLFKMIRWAITGEVVSGMKSNTVVQNNLLIFNKNLPELDDVIVSYNIDVNGVPVTIERSLHRNWKSATLEQKSSKEWKDYISSLNRDLIVIINPGKENEKILTGENAQVNINIWFGETVNNIMFFNQSKIESFLRSNPDELNKMVLNYIGVDYVQKLEDNLDEVKKSLVENTMKPKMSKDDIQIGITDYEIFVKKYNDKLEELKSTDLTSIKSEINKYEKQLEENSNSLMSLGNIPEQITTKEGRIKELTTEIDTFVIKPLKDKIVFSLEKPQMSKDDTQIIVDNQQKIETIKTSINQYKESLKTVDNSIDMTYEQIATELSSFKQSLDELITKENEILDSYNNDIQKYKQSIEAKRTNLINDYIKSKNECVVTKTQLEENKKSKEAKIEENKKAIESGFCSLCKRPFSDDFEVHKDEMLKHNEKLTTEIEVLKIQIDEYRMSIDGINNSIKTIETSDYNKLNTLVNIEDETTKINDTNQLLNDKVLTIGKYKDLLNKAQLFETNVTNKGFTYQNIKGIIEQNQNNLNKSTKVLLETMYTLIIGQYNNNNSIRNLEYEVLTLNNQIQEINNNFNRLQTDYINKLQQNEELNKQIEKDNELIKQHNNKLELIIKEKEITSNELNIVINKKPTYDNLTISRNSIVSSLNQYKEQQNSINEEITKVTIELTNNQNELKRFEQMYDDYLLWQKNQIIWKIYNRLIKDGFKDIVFEYYRCFLNNTLNSLLEDVNFKLYWDNNKQLFMVEAGNGTVSYQPVINSSGMETSFLGLSLIYTVHLLNVKNSISHIFIDELSGTLSKGDNLTYEARNYQDLFVKILNKFTEKTIFIVDHNIDNLFETLNYEVFKCDNNKESKFRKL